jgi:microcystin degradation protein MlrC
MSFTVLTAEFSHETNTFNCKPADYAAFAAQGIQLGDDAIALQGEANTEIAGFLDIGRQNGWRLIHTVSAFAQPCGPVTRDAYERIAGMIIGATKQHKNELNGILLDLHGAMVTEFSEDGEGELLERLRAVVGSDLPIGMTLDLHANVTRRMARLADIIVCFKSFPHVDMRECGRQAAGILHRAMRGEVKPVTIRAERPMLSEVNDGRTDIGAMVERIARARAYEREPDVFAVSVNAGFPNADIEEVGPTVLVTCQGDLARHRAFAEALAHDMWTRRFESVYDYLTVEEAARQAKTFDARHGPFVIADYADNPGAGGYGDSTNLLRAMIEADVQDACFGPIVDPEAAAETAPPQSRGSDLDPAWRQDRSSSRRRTARARRDIATAQQRRFRRRRADARRIEAKLGHLRSAPRRRHRHPRHHHSKADARPATVPHLWH